MPYVIINPVSMAYDGGYFDKAEAEHMLHFWQTEHKQPATFMAFIEGAASKTLEPHFRWMANVEVPNQ